MDNEAAGIDIDSIMPEPSSAPPSGEELGRRILAMADITSEIVTVPEWGNIKIEVRSMTGAERAAMLSDSWDQETESVSFDRMFPNVVVACSFHPETGEKLFSTQQIPQLNGKNSKAMQRVAEVGMRLSGLNEKEEKKRLESFPERDE